MDRTSVEAEDAVRGVLVGVDVELCRVRVRCAGGRDFGHLVIGVSGKARER